MKIALLHSAIWTNRQTTLNILEKYQIHIPTQH